MLRRLFVMFFILVAFAVAAFAQALPSGATVSTSSDETWAGDAAGSDVSEGGNITSLTLSGKSQTEYWQGYYGNVSGNLTLRDTSGDRMYSWNITNITGEVYASIDNGVTWVGIVGEEDCMTDEAITGTGEDRVNNTFTNTTVSWTVGATSIVKACQTYTYISSLSQSNDFEEIILDEGANSVYGTKTEYKTAGFDGKQHHFQMIVPSNSTKVTYYFYIEFG